MVVNSSAAGRHSVSGNPTRQDSLPDSNNHHGSSGGGGGGLRKNLSFLHRQVHRLPSAAKDTKVSGLLLYAYWFRRESHEFVFVLLISCEYASVAATVIGCAAAVVHLSATNERREMTHEPARGVTAVADLAGNNNDCIFNA